MPRSAMMLSGVSRDEQYFHLRTRGCSWSASSRPLIPGMITSVTLSEMPSSYSAATDRITPVGGRKHAVATHSQHPPREVAQIRVVFHTEWSRCRPPAMRTVGFNTSAAASINGDTRGLGPLPRLALGFDRSFALPHDAINRERPSPDPFAAFVEKKGSNMCARVSFRLPTPVSLTRTVAYGARFQIESLRLLHVQSHRGGFECSGFRLLHRVSGIFLPGS